MGFLPNIGTTELIIIVVVLVFLFGGKKFQEWARGLGETGRELKKAKRELDQTLSKKNNNEPVAKDV